MFRVLGNWILKQMQTSLPTGWPPLTTDPARDSTRVLYTLHHPLQLIRFLEEVWAYRDDPSARTDLPIPESLLYGVSPGLESGVRGNLFSITNDIYKATTAPRS